MGVFRTIVDQQQKLGGAKRVGQQVQEFLGRLIDPMQVLEDYHQRLIETLAQQEPLDRLQRPPFLQLPVRLRKRVIALDNAEQTEKVRQRVFERPIEGDNFPIHLFAASAFIVPGRDLEVAVQEIEYRQISTGLAVRDRNRLQYHPAGLRGRLELEVQPRLADAGLRHRRHDLPVSRLRQLGGVLKRIYLALTSDEP